MTTETFLAYSGIVLGILGIVIGAIISYYFYKRSIRVKEPVYAIRSINIITGSKSKYENLRILYFKKEVENFTVSKILFYNRGSETITRKDIETGYPIRVLTKDCQLLDASVLQVNKPSNNFGLLWHESGQFVYIDFDYLDKNQGAVIQLVHDGLSSDDLTIEGDIMGVQKLTGVAALKFITRKENTKARRQLINAIGIVLLISIITSIILTRATTILETFQWFLPLLLSGILVMFIGYVVDIIFSESPRSVLPRSALPEGLEKFLE